MNSPIRCERLTKTFRRTVALEGVDLTVPRNSIYALVGPNGAGKTTLIKLLLNLQRPSSGAAIVLEKDARRLSPRELARIGYISENQELPEWMTVAYVLEYLRPFYPTWDDAIAEALIKQFGLPTDRSLRQLSRGMKVKTAFIASLAYRPELLILDEPFTGLDPLVRDEIIEGLLERASDTTVLISSHDLTEIESFASHVGYLEAGTLQFSQEMAALAARFREIEVTRGVASVPSHWPKTWLGPETSASVVRFIESEFHPEATMTEVRRVFPDATDVAIRPMPLREIFIALARSNRKAA